MIMIIGFDNPILTQIEDRFDISEIWSPRSKELLQLHLKAKGVKVPPVGRCFKQLCVIKVVLEDEEKADL